MADNYWVTLICSVPFYRQGATQPSAAFLDNFEIIAEDKNLFSHFVIDCESEKLDKTNLKGVN